MNFTLNKIIRSDRPNNNGLCPIYLRYTFNRKYYNIPTELTVSINYWNTESNEFTRNYKEKGSCNLIIGKIESEVRKHITDFKIHYDRFPDPQELKTILQSGPKKGKNLKTYFEEFVKYKTEKKSEKSTLIVYNTTWKIWDSFQQEEKKVFLIKDMTYSTFDRFQSFCERKGKQNNTIGKYIKTLKTFLHYLESFHGVTLPTDFKNVKTIRNDSDFEVFTRKELEILKSNVFFSSYEFNPTYNVYGLTEHEMFVGKIMVILCSTGLSFVDFDKLTIHDIIFDKSDYDSQKGCYIKITRTKLKKQEMCVIPILDHTIDLIMFSLGVITTYDFRPQLLPFDKKIDFLKNWIKKLKENNGESAFYQCYPRIFPKISNQVFNRDIKEVCKKLKMDDPVKVSVKKYNRIEEKTVPKYTRISSHTGRRTYITLSLEQGVRLDVLMKTTGHKKFDTMNKYTKLTDKTVNTEFLEKIKLRP